MTRITKYPPVEAAYLKSFQELMVIAVLLAAASALISFFAIKDGAGRKKTDH